MIPRPFTIQVPERQLADLQVRLNNARWPDEMVGSGWRCGCSLVFLRELVAYWRERFDWRAAEARLNRLPQFLAKVGGREIHFVQVRGRGPRPLPLIITHGWPSSFAEFAKIIPLLADPASHGGDAEDAFDIVAPSLPGYGFSARPTEPGTTNKAVADLWASLMTDVLGYNRFVAHGGDFGGNVTNRLARYWPDRTVAIHTTVVLPTAGLSDPTLSSAERSWLEYVERWREEEGGYAHQQRTRPQTLAFGLNDSPIGLAAWIAEKWQSWSDCGGDPLARFTMDELLTNISIYWFTETIGSSVRMYFENAHAAEPPLTTKIEVPARVFLTREPCDLAPREYAERSLANLSYALSPRGGHFLAAEEPELLAQDIRAFFRAYR